MDAQGKSMLTRLLAETLGYVPNKATPDEVTGWAGKLFISEDWRMNRFDDIAKAIQNGIDGKYGKAYHFFTYQILTEWLGQYDLTRCEYFEQRNKNAQSNAKMYVLILKIRNKSR